MKIYTKTGDDGTTARIGGSRVPKSDPFIDAYGTLDELNAQLGHAAAACTADNHADLLDKLQLLQGELFVLGSRLACTPEKLPTAAWLPDLPPSAVARMEAEIDRAESHVSPLKTFILPGGSELAARLHLARTTCRRAERLAVALPAHPATPAAVTYLNRLSDWLFVHARLANHLAAIPDVPWTNPATTPK
jgi:cob(I)alamin adenosyltransferase